MLRRTLFGLVAAFAVTAAQAQVPPPAPTSATPPRPAAAKPNPRVKLQTTEGDIVLELYADKAPISVVNYLKYVDRGLFNGATFYRASRPEGYTAADYGFIEGGLQGNPAKTLPPIAHEPTTKTGLTHKLDGAISMARFDPGSARGDWTITLGDMSYLDADPKGPRNVGYAVFGQVVEGLDVVRKIIVLPTDPTKGEGAMKGQMLKAPVRIVRASRVAAALPAPPVL